MSVFCASSLMSLVMAASVYGFTQNPPRAQARQSESTVGKSRAEGDDFSVLQGELIPSRKVAGAEAFLATYPNSRFIQDVQMIRFTAYVQMGNTAVAAAAAQQAIAELIVLEKKLLGAASVDKKSAEFRSSLNQSEERILAYYHAI